MNRAEMCPLSYRNLLHWLTQPNREDFLYCFDIAEERIFPIPPPPVQASAEMSITVLDDFLSICVVSEDSIDIWQMLDYGMEGSWKRTPMLDLGHAIHVPLSLPSQCFVCKTLGFCFGAFGLQMASFLLLNFCYIHQLGVYCASDIFVSELNAGLCGCCNWVQMWL